MPKGEVFNVTIIILSSCYRLFRFTIFAPNLKTSGSYTFLLYFSRNSILLYALALSNSKAKSETRETKEQKTKTKNILDEKNKNFTN